MKVSRRAFLILYRCFSAEKVAALNLLLYISAFENKIIYGDNKNL
jgi:hypothetical protein